MHLRTTTSAELKQHAYRRHANLGRGQAPPALFLEVASHSRGERIQGPVKRLPSSPPPSFALVAGGTTLKRPKAAQGPLQRQRSERGVLFPGAAETHKLGERLGRLRGEAFGIAPCFSRLVVDPRLALAQAQGEERL